ncbi:hypothetical protein PG991_006740 [Apiospora marii]|uniref:BTB domain-containing protein n=1 Tax=Apiospora marii TaxID=335849 RepID=A0ABR1RY54_9PEZI
MAASPFENIVSSETFQILVGPQEREFTVHEAAFTRVSERFNTLFHGDFKEARERLARLEDVDEHTFARFCEFAYTGNYAISSTRTSSQLGPKTPVGHQTTSDPPSDLETNYDAWQAKVISLKSKKKKKLGASEAPQPSKKDQIWARFLCLSFDKTDPSFAPIQDQNHSDCSDTLLPHAQLYVFADYNLVTELQRLTLFRLHATLCVFRLTKQGAEDIVRLIDYSFENTSGVEGGGRTLREVITLYAACHLEDLWCCSAFQDVLLRQNEFSRDLIGQVRDRLS